MAFYIDFVTAPYAAPGTKGHVIFYSGLVIRPTGGANGAQPMRHLPRLWVVWRTVMRSFPNIFCLYRESGFFAPNMMVSLKVKKTKISLVTF